MPDQPKHASRNATNTRFNDVMHNSGSAQESHNVTYETEHHISSIGMIEVNLLQHKRVTRVPCGWNLEEPDHLPIRV